MLMSNVRFYGADAAVGSATRRTIALRFYARGMAVNLYRITEARTTYYRARGARIESLAPVELRRVPDPCPSLPLLALSHPARPVLPNSRALSRGNRRYLASNSHLIEALSSAVSTHEPSVIKCKYK